MSRLPVGVRRRGDRFQARWRDESGRGRSATFATCDEAATVGEWHQRWRATAQGRPSTLVRDDSYLRTHFLPTFSDRSIGEITTWELQEWVTALRERLAPPASTRFTSLRRRSSRQHCRPGEHGYTSARAETDKDGHYREDPRVSLRCE